MKRRILGFTFMLYVVVLIAQGGGIPQLINYQGILLDSDGNPVTGEYSIEFLLYDVEEDGTALWSEVQVVSITDGLFNVLLGSHIEIPSQVFDSTHVYLAQKIESDEEMEPRKRLVSVGYAFRALNADSLNGHASSYFLQVDQTDVVSLDMVVPDIISSINGVSNDGGNVDLVEGSNVTITPDDEANTITIALDGEVGGDDLGNHQMTQNVITNGYWFSGDGEEEGLQVNRSNKVHIFGHEGGATELRVTGEISASSLIEGDDLRALGSVITGTPDIYYNPGDIVSTQDVRADGQIRADGNGGCSASMGTSGIGLVAWNPLGMKEARLAEDNHGVWGGLIGDIWGYLGGDTYAVYGSGGLHPTRGYLAGPNNAVYGETSGDIYGYLAGGRGVYGQYNSAIFGYFGSNVYGVYGYNTSSTAARFYHGGSSYAYFGGSTRGGFVKGNFEVDGTLINSGNSLRIDHPLDPSNQYLQHSHVVSSDMKNIYDGVAVLDASGEATVELPEWFEALNRDFRYQLTCIGGFAPVYIKEKISANGFTIAGGEPGMEVSWQITGIRQDVWAEANRINVEVQKQGKERGTYLYPELYSLPVSMRHDYEEIMLDEEIHQSVLEENERIQQEKVRDLKEEEAMHDPIQGELN